MNWHELFFDLITLWVTIDPIGTLPVFLSVTKRMNAAKRKSAAIRASIIAFAILAGFLYLGQYLLEEMRIELLSFQIAGGIILFLFALSMIFEKGSSSEPDDHEGQDVAVFPLAMPSIATPGALLTVVVLTDNNTHSFFEESLTCGVMVFVLLINLALMLLSNRIVLLLGRAGLSVLSRVMGIILASAAVEMVYSALKGQLGPG
ncbi:MAG TPA: MarC family protein [Tepidisphaeraceae bacterium]|jgi:multiple antibiotic resistance protein